MTQLSELLATDFRPLNREASDLYLSVVAQVKPDALTLPTPCPDWTLRGLLRHQVSQNEGFAAAARGEGARLPFWRSGDLGDDPYASSRASVDLVTRAFADVPLDATLVVPEIQEGRPLPASLVISFHLVDLVVHAWDAATTIGVPWEPAEDLLAASLKIAALVPDDDRGPDSFLPKLEVAPATPKDRLLTLLGRSPSWQ